jgi:hypothetical protein
MSTLDQGKVVHADRINKKGDCLNSVEIKVEPA